MDAGEGACQHTRKGAERRPELPVARGSAAAADEKKYYRNYEQQDGQHEHRYPPPET